MAGKFGIQGGIDRLAPEELIVWEIYQDYLACIDMTVVDPPFGAQVAATLAAALINGYGQKKLQPTPAVYVTAITVTPANPTVPKNQTEQMTATALYSDGTNTDVTTSVNWAVDPSTVATINPGGLLASNSSVGALITASLIGAGEYDTTMRGTTNLNGGP